MQRIILFGAILVTVIFGCVEHDVSPYPVEIGSAKLPIINGELPDAQRHEAVVAILINRADGTYICSGTLISGNVVLTAAHCTDVEPRRKPRFKVADPSQLRVFVGDDLSTSIEHSVQEVVIHEGYNRKSLGVNDISLIRLRRPVPACTGELTFPSCADPVAALPNTDGLAFNDGDIGVLDNLDFAGFGVTAVDGSAGTKMHVFGTLGGFGCAVVGCSSPGNPETQFSYEQVFVNPDPDGEDGQGPCFGDSGGATFIQRGDTWYSAGITSWGDSNCSVFGVSMRVDGYHDFIKAFVLDGGCETDQDCDDGSECTLDTCEAGACSNTSMADDTLCAAGICCGGVCAAPVCSLDTDCGDGDSCTVDLCTAGGTCAAACDNAWPSCGLDDGCCGPGCTASDDPNCTSCLGNKGRCIASDECCSGVCRRGRCKGN
ncbi:MAG: trypsin-like serine protease [Proteobacteria bacterium]|nr:trypsin-like serine protease [Pseudomonadota bacterium]